MARSQGENDEVPLITVEQILTRRRSNATCRPRSCEADVKWQITEETLFLFCLTRVLQHYVDRGCVSAGLTDMVRNFYGLILLPPASSWCGLEILT